MKPNTISAAFTTDKVKQTRDFYVEHFDAKVTFDCGWYVNLQFGNESASLQFMSPRQPGQQLASGEGVIYNFQVDNVDAEYDRLMRKGLTAIMPLENHPWGDRGFAILDPNGVSIYIYALRTPSDEFAQYFK
ncbi:MAG: glyoxalase [Gammaproteobacteria bacterium]|nr:glyoxalase [Gammaproteobacteria bacterium]